MQPTLKSQALYKNEKKKKKNTEKLERCLLSDSNLF